MKAILIISFILSFSTLAGATTAKDVKQKTSEAALTATAYTKEQKEQFQKEMNLKLDDFKKNLAEMKAESAKKSASAKKTMKSEIADLEDKEKNMKKDLAKLEKSSGQAWEEMKNGINKSWDDLSDSYKKAKEKFKDEK